MVWVTIIDYFTTSGRSHIYDLPYPFADSLDPMDQYYTFDVSNIIPKTPIIGYTRLLIPFSRIYVGLTPKTAYIRICAKC